ncbi:4-amino-4-deoxy-L-arabinose transferase [Rhizobium tibeticum]|uniref:4-amino-4-deoxy-L-arabinose transferase n=1 Tax=Rhizobium tibeticum TaxID=501024 RepID=A0A1H8D0H3_9HYPH|nr:glycosyltransferase family 39 protein [Rhizobium tibeticum]SEH50620.1 putative membrane protein [Rhizobium tibeticum]SEM99947.1 4-amino-4-deoxy-L-arabinose transferase [Rhizobium tibeticum]
MSARLGFFIILGVTLWRVITLHFDTTDLFVDEAQYWFWSQNLDFGYYSKPPMIAWVIRAMTELAGSTSIYWIRVGGPLIHMATSIMLMKTAKRFVGPDIEGWTGVTFITLPGVALSSAFFSTDVVLLFFLTVALWAYFGLIAKPSASLAILMGFAFGCAFLSKYAILFVVPGGLIALILLPSARIAWRHFFVSVIVALAVAAPNVWWNLAHDGTTIHHTTNIAHWSKLGIDVAGGLEFFAAQFGVVGPIVFFAMLWAVARAFKGKNNERESLLIWLSIPVVLLITLQALVAKAYANWGVTAYIAGTMLAVWLLHRLWPKGLRLSLAINGTASFLFPLAAVFAHQLVLPNGNEIMKRYLGRSAISREAGELARRSATSIIVSDSRDLLADMFHTLRNDPVRIYAKPPAGAPDNYYEQTFSLPGDITDSVLFVTMHPVDCVQSPELVQSWRPTEGYYRGKTIFSYRISPACLAGK